MPILTRRSFLKLMATGTAAALWQGNKAVPAMASPQSYRLKDTKVAPSLCIYCGVGCGLLAYSKDGKIVNVEGDPDNPNNEGGLCPKGASLAELYSSPRRLKKILYRAPYSDTWEEKEWSWAIPEIAKRIKATRDKSFTKTHNGVTVNRTEKLAQLGGASHDTDENYLLMKFAKSLGIVNLEHQARICHSSTVGSLAPSFGRGAMTNSIPDVANADVILICGGNPAENHPGVSRFINRARDKGAIVISVDPRYTKSSVLADLYAPIRPGTDVVFFNAIANYIMKNKKYFEPAVVNYTNASYILKDDFAFKEGYFSGWDETKNQYDFKSWDYQIDASGAPLRDKTLQNPQCVFQHMIRFYSRYTPEMVEKTTGMKQDIFLKISEVIASTGVPDKAATLLYAMGLTQHTHGVQNIRAFAIVQLLLGNLGIPGGGINAMRGESNVQGSTDNGLLYDALTGYLPAPTEQKHATLEDYLKNVKKPNSFMENAPNFAVSLLKAWWGDKAQPENNFCYEYLPKYSRPHSFMDIFDDMYAGGIEGMMLWGMNPVVSGPNYNKQGAALEKLDWLMAADLFESETHRFWKRPGVDPKTIKTEVFLLPAAGMMEKDGSATNTSRWLQIRYKSVEPIADSKEDSVMIHLLVEELKRLYAEDANAVFPDPIRDLTWGYGGEHHDTERVFREMNGWTVGDKKQLSGFAQLKGDGSTASGNWIYCGMYPPEGNLARRRIPEKSGIGIHAQWAWAWPMNRRILYNRAGCDLAGKPFSDKKELIHWDSLQNKWTGMDVPDFIANRAPSAPLGDAPFLMIPYGLGRLFVPTGMVCDGPIPEHYESYESPVHNTFSKVQSNPVAITFNSVFDKKSEVDDDNFPYVGTTYRLCEHYQSGNITRKIKVTTEAAPEAFVEIDPDLAKEKGIKNGEFVELSSIRGTLKVKAFVTPRLQPYTIDGKKVHVVGMPWNYGFIGIDPLADGNLVQIANMLTPAVGDPNTRIPEYKSFKVNVRRI
ncbi:formate dehydrogenase major subunit [Propionispira arboris]|uniref:Formate dehydrogenase major subunit n=1 Tax=Propionispira arboris TaxID=84035 RepID=A0A1H6Y0C4_9FIRM|nr:formate dehydrogenase-N subunit alpha [Propionispira arboris]SEJ30255.1 formate dehydrogenase major subunit [Propionispira arboris]